MISTVYLLAGIAQLAMWVVGIRVWFRRGRPAGLGWVLLPATLLGYENLRVAVGRVIGPGELLYGLSVPALAWHWAVLPFFVLGGFAIAREAGLASARTTAAVVVTSMFVTALFAIDLPWALGLLFGPIGPLPVVELRLGCIGDAVRYTATLSEAYLCSPTDAVYRVGPGPIVAVAMVVYLLIVGAGLWRSRGWPWLALSAAVMFLAAGAGPAFGALAAPVANLGEVVLIAGLLTSGAWSSGPSKHGRSEASDAS